MGPASCFHFHQVDHIHGVQAKNSISLIDWLAKTPGAFLCRCMDIKRLWTRLFHIISPLLPSSSPGVRFSGIAHTADTQVDWFAPSGYFLG